MSKPKVNVKRPDTGLDLRRNEYSKPNKTRSVRDGREEARLLASVGEKLGPDNMEYIGSFATHVYRTRFAVEAKFVFVIQTTDLRKIPEKYAQDAVNETARTLARIYGHKPAKRVGEKREDI